MIGLILELTAVCLAMPVLSGWASPAATGHPVMMVAGTIAALAGLGLAITPMGGRR